MHAFVAVIHEGGSQSTYPVGTVDDRINTIAQHLDPAVSVLISGHSHTVVDTRVGHALVIQASSFTRAFDDVHLLLDRQAGTIAATWASVLPVWENTPPLSTDPSAPAVTPDPAVQKIVDAAVTATNPVTQQVINTAAADVPSQRDGGATPAGESPAGDLIADSQRAYTNTQLAFVNTGSVRAGLQAGQVTYGDLFTMQPFQDDYVDTFSLTGAQVWALLRAAARRPAPAASCRSPACTSPTPAARGRARSPGSGSAPPATTARRSRTTRARSYTGTANSFMIGGGDGFTVLEGAANIVQTADAELVPLVVLRRHAAQPVHVHDRRPDRDRLVPDIGAATRQCTARSRPRTMSST